MTFYLFGGSRIKQLEESLAQQKRLLDIQQQGWKEDEVKLHAAQNQIEYLVRTIRDMDDQIFKISQNADGSWARVQPNIKTLCDGMTARKVAESNRISDILRPQLIETYNDRTNIPKRITK